MTLKEIQRALNDLNYGPLKVDGIMGAKTKAAIRALQAATGLDPDGIAGPKTQSTLAAMLAGATIHVPGSPGAQWPRQKDVPKVFGHAGSPAATRGLVTLPLPMRLAWDKGNMIKTFKCHEGVEVPLSLIFQRTVQHYGEASWRSLGLDLFGGCYNLRKMRGSEENMSMHAYGIAVDIDPERNQLKWGRDRAQLALPEYEAFWLIVESVGATSLGRERNFDWMHFQFARL